MHINKISGNKINPKELVEVKANLSNSRTLADIQSKIKSNSIKDKNNQAVFAADNQEFIESIIKSKKGEILLYYINDELVCFFELTCPNSPNELIDKYHLNKYFSNEEHKNMGVAETFVVLPKYRGNGLQIQMLQRLEEIALEKDIKHLIGTVHPENIYSTRNFDFCNYKNLALIELYGGPRLLKYKKISD